MSRDDVKKAALQARLSEALDNAMFDFIAVETKRGTEIGNIGDAAFSWAVNQHAKFDACINPDYSFFRVVMIPRLKMMLEAQYRQSFTETASTLANLELAKGGAA